MDLSFNTVADYWMLVGTTRGKVVAIRVTHKKNII